MPFIISINMVSLKILQRRFGITTVYAIAVIGTVQIASGIQCQLHIVYIDAFAAIFKSVRTEGSLNTCRVQLRECPIRKITAMNVEGVPLSLTATAKQPLEASSASSKPLMRTDFACVSYGIVTLKPVSTSKSLLSSVPTSPCCILTALAIANMSRVNWELAKVNSYALSVSMKASG